MQQRPQAGACTVLLELWFVVLVLQTGRTPVASASCAALAAHQTRACLRAAVRVPAAL